MAPPPPINLKQPSGSTSQTLTSAAAAAATATSAQDARLLVRETLRISAGLASAPPDSAVPSVSFVADTGSEIRKLRLVEDEFVASSLRLICCEEVDGRRWKYVAESDASTGKLKKNSFRALSLQTPQTPVDVSFVFFYSFFEIRLFSRFWFVRPFFFFFLQCLGILRFAVGL